MYWHWIKISFNFSSILLIIYDHQIVEFWSKIKSSYFVNMQILSRTSKLKKKKPCSLRDYKYFGIESCVIKSTTYHIWGVLFSHSYELSLSNNSYKNPLPQKMFNRKELADKGCLSCELNQINISEIGAASWAKFCRGQIRLRVRVESVYISI